MSLFDLSNRNIIVTGSNRGNGLAIANGLIDAGANVFGIDLEIDNKHNFKQFKVDLTNIDKVNDLIDQIALKYGAIKGLVNNAGVSLASENPYNDSLLYRKTLEVNLNAVFFLTSKVCEMMKKSGGGSVINITSLGADLGFPDNPSYQISKAGLKQLSKAFAYDWSKYNIRFNNICPGYIKTSMTEKSFNDKNLRHDRESRTFLERWGQSEDLIGASIFLLSDASSYITASSIYVDGGWTAKGI
tara:strand:- start:10934 stop:11665 length:732 start_codon:yes stop_codon:yes gene_type:complete